MSADGADGGTAAFVRMVREHDRGLRALSYRLLDDREAMDDVMQDAYLRAFRAFPYFRGGSQARTWLYRIVYNACMDRRRSDRRRREVSLDSLIETDRETGGRAAPTGAVPTGAALGGTVPGTGWRSGGPGKDDPGESVARRDELASALAGLPEDQRAAVLLVDAIGFAHEEAAAVLGVRPGTIASRLHYARASLRATLVDGEGS